MGRTRGASCIGEVVMGWGRCNFLNLNTPMDIQMFLRERVVLGVDPSLRKIYLKIRLHILCNFDRCKYKSDICVILYRSLSTRSRPSLAQ